MGGNTGNIRTLRNQSGTVGYRTLGSILASDSGAGAGSVRRIYGYYAKKNGGNPSPFNSIFDINRGQFASRALFFIDSIYHGSR
jgi:hypothetical protein